MRIFFIILVVGSLATGGLISLLAWMDGTEMSIHGWIAMWIGVVLSMALGAGLMALVFYSARRGYDDRISVDTSPSDDQTTDTEKRS